MGTDLIFNSIQLLVPSSDGEAFCDHGGVVLVEVGDHLPQSHAIPMKDVFGYVTLHVAR
jgi:hypothetical protein